MDLSEKDIEEIIIITREIFSHGGKVVGILYLSKILLDLILKAPEIIHKYGDALLKIFEVIDKIKQRKK